MTDSEATPWIVTTSPHDHRPLNGSRPHLPLFPPRPVFMQAPAGWPKVQPAPGVQSAARALHALSVLDQERGPGATIHVANAPGTAVPRVPHVSSLWDLVLVVDTGASMTAWYPTIDSFFSCAHEVPLFTSVQVVKLHSQGFDPDRTIFDKVALENAGLGSRSNKIVFFVTDGVGPVWHRDEIWQRIREWARTHPLAILHVQPHQNWSRSALRTRTLTLRSTGTCGPNPTLEQKPTDPENAPGLIAPPPIGPDDVIVPVLELHKRWLDQWCGLQLSRQWVRQQAIVLTSEPTTEPEPPSRAAPGSADYLDRVFNFLASASPDTATLARHLAAAPLNRHIMQLVGAQLMPTAGPGDLAEILSSGLIRVTDTTDPDDAPHDRVTLDFEPGVREALLAREGWEKCQAVAEVVEKYLAPTVKELRGLARRIEFRTPPDALVVTADNLPFVTVEKAILQALPFMGGNEALRQMERKIDAFHSRL
ncbi:SAV_2336 N-terminal domain-related protein [Streptomyces sp. NPDC002073]